MSSVEDFRQRIRERLEPGEAELVVRWADGEQQRFPVVDTRRIDGWLIVDTPDGEQIEVSPALEAMLVGRPAKGGLQP